MRTVVVSRFLFLAVCLVASITSVKAGDCFSKWNDDKLKLYSIHLEVNGKDNIVVHLKANPKDEGVELDIFRGKGKANLNRIFLSSRLTVKNNAGEANELSVLVYYLADNNKDISLYTLKIDETDKLVNAEKPTAELPFMYEVPADEFHKRFRSIDNFFYDRKTCSKNREAGSNAEAGCDLRCKMENATDCATDIFVGKSIIFSEADTKEFEDFRTSYACNLYFRKKSNDNSGNLVVYYEEGMALDLPGNSSCFDVSGYQFQIIDKNWIQAKGQELRECKRLAVTKFPVNVSEVEGGNLVMYIIIGGVGIVIIIVLAGLYVYLCSDDELDEILPPPGEGNAAPAPGAPSNPGTASLDKKVPPAAANAAPA